MILAIIDALAAGCAVLPGAAGVVECSVASLQQHVVVSDLAVSISLGVHSL